MAHIWVQEEEGIAWQAHPLDAGRVAQIRDVDGALVEVEEGGSPGKVEVIRAGEDGMGHWVLLTAPGESVLVNGRRLPSGIRVLRDRDELVTGGRRLYFSAEERPVMVAFRSRAEEPPRKTFCARCKDVVTEGAPAVRCPGCGAWHHQDVEGERPCWTYAAACALCAQPTEFGKEFRWSPAKL